MPKDIRLKTHGLISALYGFYATRKLFSNSQYSPLIPVYISLAIQGHHGFLRTPTRAAARIFEWHSTIVDQTSAIVRKQELDNILQEAGLPTFSSFNPQSEMPTYLKRYGQVRNELPKDQTALFLLDLLYSVLIDADRMDAANISFPKRGKVESTKVEEYCSQLSINSRHSKSANDNVIDGRDDLFKTLSDKAEQVPLSQHVYSLTAPTGYGKTLSAFHFALKLRERLVKQDHCPRIIYVAPYLSILDQNYQEIAKALKVNSIQSGLLLLHHHLAEMQYSNSDLSEETFSGLDSELLIEGWNSEVIVTSFMQFFYGLMGSRASQLRRLHNMVGSIIILDEIQAIPHEYWSLVRSTLDFVANKLGMYIILTTATQPLIFSRDEIVELAEDLSKKLWSPRVTIKNKTTNNISLDAFIEEVNQLIESSGEKSTLVVMNTISTATKVFDTLKTDIKKYYLSANVVPAERTRRITEISEALRRRIPLVLVSTQVVEAGVNLDFNTVVRDIGPIDSIVQVAGRCNRNGLRRSEDSEVHVYSVIDAQRGTRYGNRIYGNYLIEKSLDVLRRACELSPFDLANEYYNALQGGSSDIESKELIQAMCELDYEKLTEFKLIDEQPSCSVFVEIDKKASEIWRRYTALLESEKDGLERKEEFLKMKHDFYNYVINVSSRETSTLEPRKGFYIIRPSEIGTLYDLDTGFRPVATSEVVKQREAAII